MTRRGDTWLVALLAVAALAGCETADPTTAVVENGYSPAVDADPSAGVTVYKAWWSVALFADPVAVGQTSAPVRVVPGTDLAYALLAPGWNPASRSKPTVLIPVQTAQKMSVDRGDTLHILFADGTAIGNCAFGSPLSTEDAAFIVERIFPGDFAGVAYDPATCSATPIADAGVVGPSDGGSDGLD
jgi:hypothetical protein